MAFQDTCKLQVQYIGGHGFIETVALVCPNLSHNFLCSWITQKKTTSITQRMALCPSTQCKRCNTYRSTYNTKETKTQNNSSRPKNTRMAETRMAERTSRLVQRIRGRPCRGIRQRTSCQMSTYGPRIKTIFCSKTSQKSFILERKGKERSAKTHQAGHN